MFMKTEMKCNVKQNTKELLEAAMHKKC